MPQESSASGKARLHCSWMIDQLSVADTSCVLTTLLSVQLVLAMGVGYFVNTMYKQGFPPKAQWGVDDIPDLTGCVIVVTGGYSGIGYETVKVGPAPARR
jgi:hypothetical protein